MDNVRETRGLTLLRISILLIFLALLLPSASADVVLNSSSKVQFNVSQLNVAEFTDSQIQFHSPLSIDSSGPLSVGSGIDLTDGTSNTIDSYSSLTIKTSSGSPTDITLNPTGVVGIQSDLDMADNNITNFFANTCSGTNEVVKRVYANGSYVCDTIPEDTGAENLSETLSAANSADNFDIDMSNQRIHSIGSGNSQFLADGDLEVPEMHLQDRGTVGDAGYTFVNDQNTGIYSTGADNLDITTGGSHAINIDGTQTTNFQGSVNLNGFDASGIDDFIQDSSKSLTEFNTSGGSTMLRLKDNGQVIVPSGGLQLKPTATTDNSDELLITNRDSTSVESGLRFDTGGSARWWFYQDNNGNEDLNVYSQSVGGDTMRWDYDTGDVDIPNGNLELTTGGNILHGGSGVEIEFNDTNNYLAFEDYDSESKWLRIDNGGGVDIEDNHLFLSGNKIQEINDIEFNGGADSLANIVLPNEGGSDQLEIHDADGTGDIAQFKDSGNVELPNGDLEMTGGNVTGSGSEFCVGFC